MPAIAVEIQGIRELRLALREYPKIAMPILQKAVDATSAVFAKHTLKNNPVPFRTGFLLQSFRFVRGNLQSRWFPTAKYAPFVEYGTKPHLILPVRARALRWEAGGGARYVTSASGRRYYRRTEGTAVFAMRVNHRGTKPKPFMRQIVRNSQSDINALFRQALQIVTRTIANQTRQI